MKNPLYKILNPLITHLLRNMVLIKAGRLP